MESARTLAWFFWLVVLSAVFAAPSAWAQGTPGLPGNALPEPLPGGSSWLGPAPGAGASPFQTSPGGFDGVLGGRPGVSTPRVPPSIMTPSGQPTRRPEEAAIARPAQLDPAQAPTYGPLALPARDEEGAADGLTLDVAIERLVRTNLNLRSMSFEIPQADADILTASLRANPILYADSQLIPYGSFSKERAGGPTQYDVNITYPLDVTRKRRARTEVARRAKKVLEAQYQDAVRVQIDNLYTAYVDVLAARETVRFATASLEGLRGLAEVTERQRAAGTITATELNPVRIQREAAEIIHSEAEEALGNSKRTLAGLLNLPPAEATAIELRGTLHDLAPPPSPVQDLVGLALNERADVVAYRLGIARSEADVKLAHANRYSDVYVMFQPYTFQNNAPFDTKSAHSWALGVTVPLPLYNRNQGNIQRAKINVAQSQNELVAVERQVVTEVERAERDYAVSRASLARIERSLIPDATQVRDNAMRRYKIGEVDVIDYLNAQRDLNEIIRQYRDTLVRHRRSMLKLNTAVGARILP